MKLIHFQGLTCYHDCIISIVNHLGLDYAAAFATLWSETDFRYDPLHELYMTKRMITCLEALGARVETTSCYSRTDADNILSMRRQGEFVIVAMDAFHIPWNQSYHALHGPHYFIAQNLETETFPCVDPTYSMGNESILRKQIIEHTYELSYIERVAKKPLPVDSTREAREILRIHPGARAALLSQISGYADGKCAPLLAKYVDAMIRNRYLYRFFLKSQSSACYEGHLFLSDEFFSRWNMVKFGLIKASIGKCNENIISDLSDHFNRLMDDEMALAEKIMYDA